MRTLLISICTASLLVAGGLFAACSSDDSTGTTGTDSGTDSSVVVDSGGVKDSGPKDSGGGTDSGGACELCGTALQIGPQNLCDDAGGAPTSQDKFLTFVECFCGADAGCATICQNTCVNNQFPSTDCSNCFEAQCGPQLSTCIADGQDAGPGDGGDGG